MLDKEKLNADRMSLYSDIDKTITLLVQARLAHDTEKEVEALHMMETLMVQTQQFLDYIGEMFEEKPEEDKVDPMNTQLEQVKAEIERRFDEYSDSILKHYDACTEARASELGKILTIINSLPQESVSEELEEEIRNMWEDDPHTKFPKTPYADFKYIAAYFANWQKEKMLKNADDYIIDDDKTVMDFYRSGGVVGNPVVFGSAPEGINVGDKVKVIIVKE